MIRSVELVSTGTELLSGRTLNRHAQVLGGHLLPLGIVLDRDTTVPDDIAGIEQAVSSALERVDVVVVSGGLGPTSDDVTRDAVARLTGRGIVMDETSRASLRTRCQLAGRLVTEQTERQALVVEGAEALPNSVGLAPGERVEWKGKTLFLLPGPPDEFLAVLVEHVMPRLREMCGRTIASRTLMTCGIGESDIVARFEEAGFPPGGLDIAYSAAPGRVEITISSPEGDEDLAASAAAEARELIGEYVYAEERLGIEEVVGRLLAGRGATVAVAESCTGGLIGHKLTSVSGSSVYFLGGVVAYSNDAKMRELGVDPGVLQREGAVSETVARAMADGVRERWGADYGVGVTGIAGPTGGTPEKPVGLVFVAVADAKRTWARKLNFTGHRERIKEWSGQMALDLLRRRLVESP